jgi:hypothetical protein
MKNKISDSLEKYKYKNTLQSGLKISSEILEGLKKNIERYNEQLKNISDSLKNSFEVFKSRNPIFIQEDWYLSEEIWLNMSIPDLYDIRPEVLEKYLIKEFDKNINSIKNRIIKDNVERSIIIDEVFESYKRKYFHSVVILSYSLIDGISNKKFGTNFWGYDNSLNELKSLKISNLIEPSSLFSIIEKRLKNRGEISMRDSQIPEKNKNFSNNRHSVVHGESYLYGTKTNAVKSILMIDFISSLKIRN